MGLKMTLVPLLGPWAELPGAVFALPNSTGTFPTAVSLLLLMAVPNGADSNTTEPTWAENKMIKSPSIYSL